MPSGIANKLDELLKDETSFDTRAGLRFLLELVKDAFNYIEEQRSVDKQKTETLQSYGTRLKHVEDGLNDFLKLRAEEQKKAGEERTWWRRLILGSVFSLLLVEITKLILGG